MSKVKDFLDKVGESFPEVREVVDLEKGSKNSKSISGRFCFLAEGALGSDYVQEKIWSGDVKTNEHPPDGTFSKSTEEVAKWLNSSHDTLKSAVASLNFYRNRNPDNMSKDKHDTILGMLHTAYGE